MRERKYVYCNGLSRFFAAKLKCNKLATYHSWFAIPFSRNERTPINVPRYLHLNLSKHVMRNISRFRLRAHTLKVEAAAWLEDGFCVCDQCPGENEHVQNEVDAL